GSRPLPADPAGARAREHACRLMGQSLRQTVWDPVAGHLGNAKRVFVVLDGGLQMVNLATLPAAGGGYLVERGPTLHYLAAERDLVPLADAPSPGHGLLALGDPDFDALLAAAPGVSRSSPVGPDAALVKSSRPDAVPADEPQPRRGPSSCGG